jgi:hypothetical protein
VEEFPPRALKGKYYVASSYDSSIPENSVHVEGHGIFTATASSHYGDPTDSGHVANYAGLYGPIKAFDRESSGTNYWYTHNNSTYTSGTGEYTGTQSLGGVSGEWIKLEKPYKTILRRFSILSYESYLSRVFKDFVVLGSNDDENWETLETFSGTVYTAYIPKYFNIVTTKAFKYYGFVCTNNGTGGASTQIKELRLFGTRQGQSTLHDGELKLTKNLTVPRIGPPLDADDTPRRDRLVVEYNTSTNPTENGMVRDTSSSGQGGFMYNDAYYDATEKALVFDGTDDYVSMSDWKYDTGFVHSFSGWIKFKLPEESWNVVYGVGNTAGTSRTNFTIWSKTNDSYFRTEADGSGSYIDHTFEFTGNMNKWLHMAVVKSSARIDSTRIYINGVLLPQTGATLADREVALPSTPQNFNLNGYGPDGTGTGNVNLSNVKFYDVALTADEVKRLYDMGRYDEGHHVVNFSKTRVGIGLGDEEAPRADLDVRGIIHANGGQSWPIPTAVFSNVTPSNTGSTYYETNIGSQWIYYNTVSKADSSGTILSPALNSRDITLTRTGLYEIYTSSSLKLQDEATSSHIGLYILGISGSVEIYRSDGYEIVVDAYNVLRAAQKTYKVLVTSAPSTVGYWMQPQANYTNKFMETAYGNSNPIHTVMIKYLG